MNGRYDPGKRKQKLHTTRNTGNVSKTYMLHGVSLQGDIIRRLRSLTNTHAAIWSCLSLRRIRLHGIQTGSGKQCQKAYINKYFLGSY